MQNQGNNQNRYNQNRGNFNQAPAYQSPVHQGQIYRPQVVQPPAYQAPAYQAPAPQIQGVSKEDFHSYVKANDAVMRNMQTQGQNMQNQLNNLATSNQRLESMLGNFIKMNTASTSGTLPSNTVTNPKEDLKGYTPEVVYLQGPTMPITSSLPKDNGTRTEVTKDTMPPTNNGSTEDVPPPVVPIVHHESISEPANAPVSASRPNQKASIPFPSRRNDERRREKANDQIEKFYEIFRDLSFEISFTDAIELMLKFATTLKTLIENTERGSFLKTSHALIDVYEGEITLRVGREAITFNLDQTSRYTANYNHMTANRIDVIDMACEEYSQEFLGFSKQVEKLLDAGLIYPISDSPWVSPVHCVPKKGGMTVVKNDENDLIPTRLVTGWRVCIDYRKLNEAIRKDHFPLPFMDQMLERLAGNQYYCFLDGFSGYFQIPIDPKDQEKTTFTCPYGTFAYRRMPFGLCNAPGTFQRCMMAIFHDMIEKTTEVFMDDFSVFGDSFSTCLSYLDKMLKRCEDTNLVLNWEKSHFMVKEGIVLGHKISKSGIEVDRAKVDVIAKLPHPTTVKGVRSFLGH
ncbi:reverse transcriptase domain-containing protein [Tanacetum coccineum]